VGASCNAPKQADAHAIGFTGSGYGEGKASLGLHFPLHSYTVCSTAERLGLRLEFHSIPPVRDLCVRFMPERLLGDLGHAAEEVPAILGVRVLASETCRRSPGHPKALHRCVHLHDRCEAIMD